MNEYENIDSDSSDDHFERMYKRRRRSHIRAYRTPEERLEQIRKLSNPKLQRFVDDPPGIDTAIIYVFVNVKDGKVYVGKHSHADRGQSFRASRLQKHFRPSNDSNTYFANAMRKHGKDAFEYFIIWHGHDSEVDNKEIFWIGPDGLHTIKDCGGWGYNQKDGGKGGRLTPSARLKISESYNRPGVRKKHSESAILQFRREEALDPGQRSRRAKNQFESQCAREELSNRSKLQWESVDATTRESWCRNMKSALANPDTIEKKRRNAKAQMERERQRGEKTLNSRRVEWNQTASEEQINSCKERFAETIRCIQETKMQGMTDKQRRSFERKIESEKRKTKRKKTQVEELRKIPGYEKAKASDIPRARLAGVLPSID
jgi:hypothetical protein